MAENGEEGFKKACEGVPDLIITDIIMPVMDGFKCCQLIKENLTTCHIPVILLTALTSETDIMKGIELGADDYIQKPFNPNILRTKVKRLIKSREELKEIYTRLLTPTSEPETLILEVSAAWAAAREKSSREVDFLTAELIYDSIDSGTIHTYTCSYRVYVWII